MRRIGIQWRGLAASSVLMATLLSAAETNAPQTAAASRPDAPGAQWHHLSPVEYFRGLLGMSPEERDRALAGKSPSYRAAILAKLKEYEAMPADIREARLCQTELHWEVSHLMKLAPRDRTNQLQEVSVLYRPLVQVLLWQWDNVPPATQKALLENENFIGTYLRLQGSPAEAQQEILRSQPPERRAHWAEEMNRWQARPEAERAELCTQFQHFCSLSTLQQQETVNSLTDAERQEMESTLQTYSHLAPQQRAECINSFRKFATMSADERNQFLKNAARWDAMTSHERQLWRDLVNRLPPLPPGYPTGLPPLPPGYPEGTPPPLPPNVATPVIVAGSPTAAK